MKKLPVVEKFVSIQGEGYWTGSPMWFIRLGGCPVGQAGGEEGSGKGWDTCTLPSGYKFRCDTTWAATENVPIEELIDWVPYDVDVCITGGEPIAYDLTELVKGLQEKNVQVHLETSGVGVYQPWMEDCWITISPKQGYNIEVLLKANEIKWLVSSRLKLSQLEIDDLLSWSQGRWVFLQPVYDVDYKENLRYCIEMVKQFPSWKLSIQLHKVIEVR